MINGILSYFQDLMMEERKTWNTILILTEDEEEKYFF